MLDYLQLHDYRFTTISPASHQMVNDRPENLFAKNLIDIFGWNRLFKSQCINPDLSKLIQSSDMLLKIENGRKSKFSVSTICVPSQYILDQQLNFYTLHFQPIARIHSFLAQIPNILPAPLITF